MKIRVLRIDEVDGETGLENALKEGFVQHPDVRPHSTETYIIYVLVKYDEVEKAVLELKKTGEFDDVESLKEVPNAEVDDYLVRGYVILNTYAAKCVMVKRKEAKKE